MLRVGRLWGKSSPDVGRTWPRLLGVLSLCLMTLLLCVAVWLVTTGFFLSLPVRAGLEQNLCERGRTRQPPAPECPDWDKIDPILEAIYTSCGPLCDTSRPGIHSLFFDEVTAPTDCPAIFKNEHVDDGRRFAGPALQHIPPQWMGNFTMGGRLPVVPLHFDQVYMGKTAKEAVWSRAQVETWVDLAHKHSLEGTYGVGETNALLAGLAMANVTDARVLVIGSEIPWVEACCLASGAKEVVTLEYGGIVSEDPRISTLVPVSFRQQFLAGSLQPFDVIVTFSSVEHSGLGRYGDGLNPWGDLLAMARAWCVAKPQAKLVLAVPYVQDTGFAGLWNRLFKKVGREQIRFNADRVYGSVRLPYLVTNWRQLGSTGGRQRVWVLEKLAAPDVA
eukprot:gb/GEZN01007313.1/.p1 GENE.gb/GEZN01007313.1/~~gb/GEZN01007313.1/.p1  ORF type:complete len:390 (-),score=34.02 gb/GEZN01007313.1/:327-1496(-)